MESTAAVNPEIQKLASSVMEQKLSRSPGKIAMIVFGCAIAAGIIYAGLKLGSDLATTHYPTAWPYVLLGIALLIALGFEFVNGFHDTANAVATVIYTHSLEPHVAVV
jgi:PiT family inorganic phosphate transporter